MNDVMNRFPAVAYQDLAVVSREFDSSTTETSSRVVTLRAPSKAGCMVTWRVRNVAGSSFGALVPGGTRVTVIVKAGFFGFPWVKGAAIQRADASDSSAPQPGGVPR